MTKYFFQGKYVGQGIKGLLQEGGSKRRDAVVEALKSVGGTLDWIYYAFGETDVLGVMDIPDQASAAALSLMINSTGAVSVHLMPLMTPEDIDAATTKTPAYRAPGA
ncbi:MULTISPECIES: GYD domain-containing protein [unclassified Salinibacterium]|uniref:GYD domain-containing protein n=1 Tax=unclassified Salinibacterium TaxID=2632331 RepID=UPI001421BA0B|nr:MULTISPECIES: GYD domain-containing protein [unclassified Salinibacterium]